MPRDEHLDKILAEFEARGEPFYEVSIVDPIRKLREELGEAEGGQNLRIQAESMAFGFCEDYRDEATGWGTYFGPFSVLKNDAGQMVESPSIRLVTGDMLNYWGRRADEVKHPKMRARYADLVWEFRRRVTGEPADVRFAQMVIDSNLEIAARDLCEHESETHTKLRRALSLALSTNDPQRVEHVREAILAYEGRTAADDMPGSWGLAFETLIENKKVPLTVGQENNIIGELEKRLERLSGGASTEQIHPQAAEVAAMLLKRYYLKLNRTEDVHRVLRLFGRAYMHWATQAAPFLGATWLKKVYEVYHEHGMKADADSVAVTLREMSEKSGDDMKTMSVEFTIPKHEIDAYLAAMTKGTVEDALNKIAVQFVPSLDEARSQLKKMASTSPFLMHVTRQLQDEQGRVTAEVGPFTSDPDGQLVMQLSQSIQFMNVLLRMAIEATTAKHDLTSNAIAEHLFASPLFEPGDEPLVRAGLDAYFNGDAAVAVHVLVPRIEAALRNFVKFAGGSVFRPDRRRGGLHLRNLDDLLRDKRTVRCMSESVTRYLQVLLTDPRGLNIRNVVCHGLREAGAFVPWVADRVLHALLVMALVRANKDDAGRET